MSKRPRPSQSPPSTPRTASTSPGAPEAVATEAGSEGRSAARRRSSVAGPSTSPSYLERYRGLLLAGFAVVGVGVAAVFFLQSATAAPYTCAQPLMTPGTVEPAPAPPAPDATADVMSEPEPAPTQRLGFVTQDLGRGHVNQGQTVDYAYCPPASGEHYNIAGQAPLRRDFYGPGEALGPGNWIHNLEHGYVMLLYRGDPGEAALDQVREVMDTAAPSELAVACGYPNKVIAARFDDMSVPFAAVAWDRAMLLPEFDGLRLRTFAEQWQDGPVTPEPIC